MNEGILLVDKEAGVTSFHLVSLLRKITQIKKIGHAGTLDPFATGLMVMLIGKQFTKKSDSFLNDDKEYRAILQLGVVTDTFDKDGTITEKNEKMPTLLEIEATLQTFQGNILQVPPMFSAKKINGKKLYEYARKNITIERAPVPVSLQIQLIQYCYPHLEIHVSCSKGTYIRSLAHDIGQKLGCGAHLIALSRTRSGNFHLSQAIPQNQLFTADLKNHFRL